MTDKEVSLDLVQLNLWSKSNFYNYETVGRVDFTYCNLYLWV